MPDNWSLLEIEQLISNQTQESLTLEYKSAAALTDKNNHKEITKDVSSFANSTGGTLIYGVKEYSENDKKHLPEVIDPIDQSIITKEWLQQVINNIRPKINGLLISIIPIADKKVIYVIDIPQSTTAHQALDHRYYKRYNFLSTPMEDYEIRDVMGRNQFPRFDLSLKIARSFEYNIYRTEVIGLNYILNIEAKNVGSVYANYINAYINVPLHLLKNDNLFNGDNIIEENGIKYYKCYKDNTTRDVVDVKFMSQLVYGPSRYKPILPGLSQTWEFELKDFKVLSPDGHTLPDDLIKWTIYADNSPSISGEIKLNEIERIF